MRMTSNGWKMFMVGVSKKNAIPHIVADVSANGFGHLAQIAPILDSITNHRKCRITLRTEIPPEICKEFLKIPFQFGPPPPDPNMRMKGPLDVDIEGLFQDYKSLIYEWDEVVSKDADILQNLNADVVLTNISVVSIASARAAGMPVAAICSLNWADVFAAYCGTQGDAGNIFSHLTENYDRATEFIKLSPHMKMDWLTRSRSVGPVARQGRDIRSDLQKLKPASYYAIASMGGIPGAHNVMPLPKLDGVVWIVPPDWDELRDDWISRADMGKSFLDLMRSADLLVTKAGYGSVTECAANATRIIYTERTNWCENPFLEKWMKDYCTACKVDRMMMEKGDYGEKVVTILQQPVQPPMITTGSSEAANILGVLF